MATQPIDISGGLVPVPPPSVSAHLDIADGLIPVQGAPITENATIGAAAKPSLLQTAGNVLAEAAKVPVNPVGAANDALNAVASQDYTQGGRAEHPIAAWFGDKARRIKELLYGGTTPMGPPQGVLNSPVTNAISLAPAGAEAGAAVEDAFVARRAEAAAKEAAEDPEAGNRLLKTTAKDFRNGVVPGRAIVNENVPEELTESANNARLSKDTVAERQHMEAIRDHLDGAIENLKDQQTTLLKHPAREGFDITPIVEDSYKQALAKAKETGSPEIVKAINKTHEEMLKIPNDDGELIVNRYLNYEGHDLADAGTTSAEEAQKAKQLFQGRSNYKSPGGGVDTPTQYANSFWKDVATKVRLKLEEQVPGIGEVNARIRDAQAASRLATKRIDTLRGMPALPSRMSRFIETAKPALIKGAAAGLGAAGAGKIAYDAYEHFLKGD